MSIRDAICDHLAQTGKSHREIAEALYVDRSMVTKVVNGKRKWPEAHDARLSAIDPMLAWSVGHERTAGFIPPPPGRLDQHPAEIKDKLLVELEEAQQSLRKVVMFFRMTEEERRQVALETCWEIDDVIREALHWQAYIVRAYGLRPDRMRKERKS